MAAIHHTMPPAKITGPAAATSPEPTRLSSAGPTSRPKAGTTSGPGATAKPVARGDQCQTCSAHTTIDSRLAANGTENSRVHSDAGVKPGTRSSGTGRTGDGWRAERTANPASTIMPPARQPVTRPDDHPQAGLWTTPSATAPMPAESSSAPAASILAGAFLAAGRGSRAGPAARTAAPIGTLMRNTHRQLASVSSPPIAGPSAAPSAPSAAQPRT